MPEKNDEPWIFASQEEKDLNAFSPRPVFVFICKRCGERLPINPCKLDTVINVGKAFEKSHKRCKKMLEITTDLFIYRTAYLYAENGGYYLISTGLSGGKYFYTAKITTGKQSAHRVKSKNLPIRETSRAAQADLDTWAKVGGLVRLDDKEKEAFLKFYRSGVAH
jgi:hypothetical protein